MFLSILLFFVLTFNNLYFYRLTKDEEHWLTSNYSTQLENAGMWHWAIYVADHLPDEERRQHRILNILFRNCPRLSDRTTSEINAEQEYMHRVQFLMQEIGKYSKRRRSNVVCNYR